MGGFQGLSLYRNRTANVMIPSKIDNPKLLTLRKDNFMLCQSIHSKNIVAKMKVIAYHIYKRECVFVNMPMCIFSL